MGDFLRHHKHYADGETVHANFMERVAEGVASGMGTVTFVVVGSLLILAWVLTNGAVAYFSHAGRALLHGGQFDPEPWILLNLIFSGVAFYTGALVIIAQKAQNRVLKLNEEAAAAHREELDNANRELLERNTELTEEIHKVAQDTHKLLEGRPRRKAA